MKNNLYNENKNYIISHNNPNIINFFFFLEFCKLFITLGIYVLLNYKSFIMSYSNI